MKFNFINYKNKQVKFNIDNFNDLTIKNFLNPNSINKNEMLEKYINTNNNKKPIITITNLNKWFNNKKKHALNNINLTFYENENVAILGSNGAGKTTLVEILAGINKADSGSIKYLYQYENSFQEKMGIQFQDATYPKGISVKSIINFTYNVYGSSLNHDEILGLVKLFGIDQFYFKKANSLSGGQNQRLNCLLAILHKPKVLILDELSTGLDVNIKTKIKTFIKEFAKNNNMTLILVSHDLEEINYLANRIIILHNGIVYVDASKDEIIKKYNSILNCLNLYL